jgi:hypothetical protein
MKCHQRKIREQRAQTPLPDEYFRRAAAGSFENATVCEISREEAKSVILDYEWLGNMGSAQYYVEHNMLTHFIELHRGSTAFSPSVQFSGGTADGLNPVGAPPRTSQESHIVDKYLTKLFGFGEWNRSINVLLENIEVNALRYDGYIGTEISPKGRRSGVGVYRR